MRPIGNMAGTAGGPADDRFNAPGEAKPATCRRSGLHRFAVLTALATLGLVGMGGLVTSYGVGMAVPDWPNTYGYNMFFFPFSEWVGGVFYEHTHRLAAAGVGLLTVVLALWLYGRNARPFMRWAGAALLLAGAGTAAALPLHRADGLVLGLSGLALLGASVVWPRCEPSAKWLRGLGWAAFVGVVLQGALGGLRVVLFKDALGIVHALLAQLFFVLMCALALFTSRWWQSRAAQLGRTTGVRPSSGAATSASSGVSQLSNVPGGSEPAAPGDGRTPARSGLAAPGDGRTPARSGLAAPGDGRTPARSGLAAPGDGRTPARSGLAAPGDGRTPAVPARCASFFLLGTLLILCQLTLGAAMRHQHAGLAIPDFPLAYGKVWPAMDAGSVARYNQQRVEVMAVNPITGFQIGLQMAHRLLAVAILGAVGFAAWRTGRALGGKNALSRLALVWVGLIVMQGVLGAATIWSNKAADIATGHVVAGALALALGAMLSIISARPWVGEPGFAGRVSREGREGSEGAEGGHLFLSRRLTRHEPIKITSRIRINDGRGRETAAEAASQGRLAVRPLLA